jgi:response regulator RpfG family c-di-GMP phosphodiesterase
MHVGLPLFFWNEVGGPLFCAGREMPAAMDSPAAAMIICPVYHGIRTPNAVRLNSGVHRPLPCSQTVNLSPVGIKNRGNVVRIVGATREGIVSATADLPRVLLVDDEPRVVESLALILRKEYDVLVAGSGKEALSTLRSTPGICVVVSDMRMPGMDGATLLQEVMHLNSSIGRVLLTGDGGRDVAPLAVNKGHILRFLNKPCSLKDIQDALDAGVAHYRMARIERAVLQETLVGCIHALVDLLAISNPAAFGRAGRVQRLAVSFAGHLGMADYWQLDCAALLSQIGYIGLPEALVDKLYRGDPLSDEEKNRSQDVPKIAMRLLDHVPRLEPVIQIIAASYWDDKALERLGEGTIGTGARILGIALEFDALTTGGRSVDEAVGMLRARELRYGKPMLDSFCAHVGAAASQGEVRLLPLSDVEVGMILMQDLRSESGTLLVSQGYKVTEALLQRVANHGESLLSQQVYVLCIDPPVQPGPM